MGTDFKLNRFLSSTISCHFIAFYSWFSEHFAFISIKFQPLFDVKIWPNNAENQTHGVYSYAIEENEEIRGSHYLERVTHNFSSFNNGKKKQKSQALAFLVIIRQQTLFHREILYEDICFVSMLCGIKWWNHQKHQLYNSYAVCVFCVLFFFTSFWKSPLNGVLRSMKHLYTTYIWIATINLLQFFFLICSFVHCIQYAQYALDIIITVFKLSIVFCSIFHCLSLEFCNWRTCRTWIIYTINAPSDDKLFSTRAVWHFQVVCFSLWNSTESLIGNIQRKLNLGFLFNFLRQHRHFVEL